MAGKDVPSLRCQPQPDGLVRGLCDPANRRDERAGKPYAQIYPSRFYEVQKYLSKSNHVYTPAYVVAGRSWNKFDPEVQQMLKDTAVEIQDVVYEIATGLDTELQQKLIDTGMEVNEVDTEAFVTASASIYHQLPEAVDGASEMIGKA